MYDLSHRSGESLDALAEWRRKRASSVGNDLDGGNGGSGDAGAIGAGGGNGGASGVTDGLKTRPVEPNATPSGSDNASSKFIPSVSLVFIMF